MSDISTATILQRNDKDFLANPVGEEMVIMDMKSGNYIGLNPVGVHIWKLIEQPTAVSDLIAKLMHEYEIDEATCKEQTTEYLNKMLEQGLIIAS